MDKKILLKMNFNIKCRICYSSISSEDNPLLCPCSCTGSISHIHFYCLKQLCGISLDIIGNSTYIYCRNDSCDLCLTNYPKFMNIDGKVYDLFNVEEIVKESKNDYYVIIKQHNYSEDKKKFVKKGYIFHKIVYNKELEIDDNKKSEHFDLSVINRINISIGRSEVNDISIKESTVSRHHCNLIYEVETKKLIVNSLNTKFGMYKQVLMPFIIDKDYINSLDSNINEGIMCSFNNKFGYGTLVSNKFRLNMGKHIVNFDIEMNSLKKITNFFSIKIACCLSNNENNKLTKIESESKSNMDEKEYQTNLTLVNEDCVTKFNSIKIDNLENHIKDNNLNSNNILFKDNINENVKKINSSFEDLCIYHSFYKNDIEFDD